MAGFWVGKGDLFELGDGCGNCSDKTSDSNNGGEGDTDYFAKGAVNMSS